MSLPPRNLLPSIRVQNTLKTYSKIALLRSKAAQF
jgi:hypothetical protein